LLDIARRQVRLVGPDLHYHHYERYSFQQQWKQNLGGLMGELARVLVLAAELGILR